MKYEQIFIKSESDLPKEEGSYVAKRKTKEFASSHLYKGKDYNELWLRTIEWYLQPLPEQTERKSANELKDQIEAIIDNAINFDLETYDRDCLDQIYDLFLSQPSEVSDTKEDNSFIACDCDRPEINDANLCIRCGGYNRNGF